MRLALGLMGLALVACAEPAPLHTASVRLTGGPEAVAACEAHCVTTLGANTFRFGETIPLGPGQVVSCGDEILFERLPAGHQVVLEAWASDASGHVLEGVSDVITVVADATVDADIELLPLSVPVIAAVSPDPVDAGATGAELTLTGSGFEGGGGVSQVELDGVPLETVAWTDESVTAWVPAGVGGTEVTVRRCGIAAEAAEARVLADDLELMTFTPPGCGAGALELAGAVVVGDELVLAAACVGADEGFLLRLSGSTCSLAPQSVPLTARPLGLTRAGAGEVWLALDDPDGLLRVELATGSIHPGPSLDGDVPAALAVAGDRVFVIAEGAGGETELREVTATAAAPVPAMPADLTLLHLAATADRLALAAVDGSGDGELVVVDLDTGLVGEWSLPDCPQPAHLAAADATGSWLAVACPGDPGGVVVFELKEQGVTWTALPAGAAIQALAFDAAGDVVLLRDAGGEALRAVQVPGGDVLATWTVDWAGTLTGPLVRLPSGHRFLSPGPTPGALAILSPYAGTQLCGEEGP